MRRTKRSHEAQKLNYDATPSSEVRAYFDDTFERKTYNPLENSLASSTLKSQINDWREEGKTIVFTSGVYDLFHANHRTYLLHAKIAASRHRYEGQRDYANPAWEELPRFDRIEFTRDSLEQDALRLIVSVDGNDAVAARKGYQLPKGNSARPVYDWGTRSRDVLSAGYETSSGQPRLIVDAVTIHDNVQPELANTPHRDIMDIGVFISPDVWSVYYESEDVLVAAQTSYAESLNGTEVVVLRGHDFYSDKLTQSPFTTSALVARLLGSASMNGAH